MAYIGRAPITGQFEKQQLTADSSTTTFALNWSVGSTSAILVSVGGVIQEPETAYNLSAGGTSITFTAAPTNGDRVYVHFLGQAIVQSLTDLNGVELILDADADTTITADTDDTIDIKISDADDFQFTANTFSVLTGSNVSLADSSNIKVGTGNDMLLYHDGSNSYITNAVGALKIATETSGIAVTIGHSTSEVTIADNLTVTGTLTLGSNAELTEAELEFLDGITAGTAAASKAMVLDSNADITGGRNLTISGELDAATLDISGNSDIDGTTNLDAVDIDGAVQIDGAFTSGVDGQGYDTKFFGDTSSAYMLWDTSADDLVFAGAAGIDLAGDIDVDGTANLDVVDIDGAVDMASTLAVAGVSSFAVAANVAQVALTSSSNAVAWDASAAANAYHLTTENTTISAPSNAVEGAFICLELNHDGTTTVAWNAIFNFAADTAPTTTDTNAKTDILVFRYNGAIWQEVGRTLNIPES